MNVVLVLNREQMKDMRVMVKLKTSSLRRQVAGLLEEDKGKEAIDLMLKKAEVADYLPPGKKPVEKPNMILMEDLF